MIQDQSFQTTGYLNQPPFILLTALNGIKTQYERKGHQPDEIFTSNLEKTLKLRQKYKRLELSKYIDDKISCSETLVNLLGASRRVRNWWGDIIDDISLFSACNNARLVLVCSILFLQTFKSLLEHINQHIGML